MIKANVVLFTFVKKNALDKVLKSILTYSPHKLYVVSDLPRNEMDVESQKDVSNIVGSYRNKISMDFISPTEHLGISNIIDFGLDSVFENEEQIIVLEDDTVPSHSFFDFCNLSLTTFKDEVGIGSIMGTNLLNNQNHTQCFKSRFGIPYWGWATWKNRWNKMPKVDDFFEMVTSGNVALDDVLYTLCSTKGMNVSWDVRWSIYQYLNELSVLLPDINLVSNEGFNHMGTFTKNEKSRYKNLPVVTLKEPSDWCLALESQNVLEGEYFQKIQNFLDEMKSG